MSFLPFLVLQVVIFIGLVAVLRRVLSRNVTDAAARLQDLTAEYGRRQEELKERLQESGRQYQEQLARAQVEADRIVSEAHQEAEASKAKRLEEARLESEHIVQQGIESRDALRKELERDMEKRSVERACQLVEDALPADLRREIQGRWLDELLRNGSAQFDRLKTEGAAQEVRIVSAVPLTKEQRETLHARLKERLSKSLTVTENVDERLVAGLMITVGSLVLDGSLAAKIRKAVRHASEAA